MDNDKSKAGNLPFTDEQTGLPFIDIATYKPGVICFKGTSKHCSVQSNNLTSILFDTKIAI